MKPQLALAPLSLVPTFSPISQIKILFMGDSTFDFALMAQNVFVLHAFHHFQQTLVGVQNVKLLVDNFPNSKFQST
jgi:hypothetical protein